MKIKPIRDGHIEEDITLLEGDTRRVRAVMWGKKCFIDVIQRKECLSCDPQSIVFVDEF